ncbi:VOC family protein [Roseococcus sp. YIM B11640]|uniref:VOC family protein n=1 Tax=Roseococcus sp. YIM B11640 TaxID=3133973 RepID=UPI003C7C09A5
MSQMIFLNLPVNDLARSIAFYEAIGATRDARFCDESTTACMVFSDNIFVMLLTHERFAGFTPRKIADAHATTEVLIFLSRESREAVDAMVDAAVRAGGVADPGPRQEHGFMYGRSFEDPDGHIWEAGWMDVAACAQAQAAA